MPNMSLTKVKMAEQEPNVRNANFLEVAQGYTLEQAKEEAYDVTPAFIDGKAYYFIGNDLVIDDIAGEDSKILKLQK